MLLLLDIASVSISNRSIENYVYANSGYPDQSPHCVVSDLGLLCLPVSNKKDVAIIRVGLYSINFSFYGLTMIVYIYNHFSKWMQP